MLKINRCTMDLYIRLNFSCNNPLFQNRGGLSLRFEIFIRFFYYIDFLNITINALCGLSLAKTVRALHWLISLFNCDGKSNYIYVDCRVVCLNFGHLALTSSFIKYKFCRWKRVLQQLWMDCQFSNGDLLFS